MNILKISSYDDIAGEFINKAFTDYAAACEVDLNFEEYCFVAENDAGEIIGAITGRAYYNEVHIGDLIVDENCRGQDIGTNLVSAVEKEYKNKGFAKFTLTTFGFQAPEFYKKHGYKIISELDDIPLGNKKFHLIKNL